MVTIASYWCCTILLLTDISSAWEMEWRLNKLGLFDRPAVKKAVQLKTLCGWIMFVPNVSHHGQSFKLSSSHSECSTCDGQALVPEGSSPPRPPCRPGDNDAFMTIVMWQYDGHHIWWCQASRLVSSSPNILIYTAHCICCWKKVQKCGLRLKYYFLRMR